MLALATIVTLTMEIFSRLFSRRARQFRHMIALVYRTEFSPVVRRMLSDKAINDPVVSSIIGDREADLPNLLTRIYENPRRVSTMYRLRRNSEKNPRTSEFLRRLARPLAAETQLFLDNFNKFKRIDTSASKTRPFLTMFNKNINTQTVKANFEDALTNLNLTRREIDAFVVRYENTKADGNKRNEVLKDVFLASQKETLLNEVDTHICDWFARSVAASPFEPERFSWLSSGLAKLSNWFGAAESTELSVDDFLRRFARSGVGRVIYAQADDQVERIIDDISRRYDEVATGAQEYNRNSSRVISIIIGILLALFANIDGLRIYKDFLLDPARAEAFVANKGAKKDASKGEFAKASAKLHTDLEKFRKEALPANGVPGSKKLKELEKAITASTSKLDGLLKNATTIVAEPVAQGIRMGWAEYPHCLINSLCVPEKSKWSWWDVLSWAVVAVFTGILIGLGAPFWYDAVTGLVGATKILRGQGIPSKPSGDEASAAAKKSPSALFTDHVRKDPAPAVDLRNRELDRLRERIRKITGSDPPACASRGTLPANLDTSGVSDPKLKARVDARYEKYKKACERLREESA
jgi:hypothetical protein